MKIIYVNFRKRCEYERDLCGDENYLSRSENNNKLRLFC